MPNGGCVFALGTLDTCRCAFIGVVSSQRTVRASCASFVIGGAAVGTHGAQGLRSRASIIDKATIGGNVTIVLSWCRLVETLRTVGAIGGSGLGLEFSRGAGAAFGLLGFRIVFTLRTEVTLLDPLPRHSVLTRDTATATIDSRLSGDGAVRTVGALRAARIGRVFADAAGSA